MNRPQQQSAQKNRAPVGIRAQLLQHGPFGNDASLAQSPEIMTRFQVSGAIEKIALQQPDRAHHQGIIQILVRAVVPAINQSRFGGEIEFPLQAGGQPRRQFLYR